MEMERGWERVSDRIVLTQMGSVVTVCVVDNDTNSVKSLTEVTMNKGVGSAVVVAS
jgi:hypothetical protein